MPIASLKLRPGVEADYTPTLNEAGISASNLIRFKDGLPQKLGGWDAFYANTVGGIPRKLHAWGDLSGVNRLAVGTTSLLGLISSGTLSDITPQTKTTNPAEDFSTTLGSALVTVVDAGISNVTTFDAVFFNTPIAVGGLVLHGLYPIEVIVGATSYQIRANATATSAVSNAGAVPVFNTTAGSPIVQVTVAAHGLAIGDDFTFPIATTVGGVTISGTYNVLTVPTADTFTIGATVEASSTTSASMNSGNAQLVYYINLGPPAVGSGFGLLGFGDGGFGTGSTSGAQVGTPITATGWSIDNWGEFLISCPNNGGIYFWPPNRGYETAFLVATAPAFNGGCFVAMPAQILVCWGSTAAAPFSTSWSRSPEQRDPLMVRWSDIEDFTNFTVSSLTQAGGTRLSSGSKIVGAMQAPSRAYIWTDIGLWTMEYMGPPIVFGFNEIGKGCGLIGQNAAATMRGFTYWMSKTGFFMVGAGGVEPIQCSVWDVIFQDLDTANADKIVAAANSLFSEITWHYPSLADGTGENSRYVKVNIAEGMAWDYGPMTRSAWIDETVLGSPIGATPSGLIYQHETSNDAGDAPLNAWFETGYFVIDEGSDFAFVDLFMPDMRWGFYDGAQDAQVAITITAVDYPNGTERSYGPFTVSQARQYANTRLRGRQMKFRVESDDMGSFWRLGNPRYRYRPDGKR